MSAVALHRLVREMRGTLAARQLAALTEAELLARYVGQRDEIAFETLVHRHGPMVLGVCRRILRNETDAEDAFQATFLVLIRRAASLRSPDALACWLHGVARRTALEARGAAARRRAKEAAVRPRIAILDDQEELRPVLDQELEHLAEKYRTAVVLCDLEGKTRQQAAQQLGWAEGTVASRLARGRSLLAKRLARRGFAGAVVTTALAEAAAQACVPRPLLQFLLDAARHAVIYPAGQGLGAAVLAEGVLKAMVLTKLKHAILMLMAAGLVSLCAGALMARNAATEPSATRSDEAPPGSAISDNRQSQVAELKQQLQQLQEKLTQLENEPASRGAERGPPGDSLSKRLRYRIPFEIGYTELREGGRLEIREVWGTRPRIEVGGQYLVRGRYVLPQGARGTLYFFETADGAWGNMRIPTLDLQTISLDQPEGEFTLLHGMSGPGYFHLYLSAADRYSRTFANVYFGTGDNVWRKKP
jgi:RNA polymerase sigma factor (sigma-70 family)